MVYRQTFTYAACNRLEWSVTGRAYNCMLYDFDSYEYGENLYS